MLIGHLNNTLGDIYGSGFSLFSYWVFFFNWVVEILHIFWSLTYYFFFMVSVSCVLSNRSCLPEGWKDMFLYFQFLYLGLWLISNTFLVAGMHYCFSYTHLHHLQKHFPSPFELFGPLCKKSIEGINVGMFWTPFHWSIFVSLSWLP